MSVVAASALLLKLSQTLFAAPADQEAFVQALVAPQPSAPCLLWLKERPVPVPFALEPSLPWQPAFVDRLSVGETPGIHPLHEAGFYYCLDFSSVFAASGLLGLTQRPQVVFDLCAAPGGKGLFAWQLFQPAHLICNETISKRVGILIGNLKRCSVNRAIALSADPRHLALRLSQTADLVLVDAPCSGQSLLAKGHKAEGCFHPVTIRNNAQRQKRILAEATTLVAPQGYLAYMTCTFSPEENERVGQWLLKKFPCFQPVPVPALAAFQSPLTTLPCYRLWPQSGLGAGAFTMLFRKTTTGTPQPLPTHQWPGWRWASSALGQKGR